MSNALLNKAVGRKVALLSGAVLAGVASQKAQASLVINLQFGTGATTLNLTAANENKNISISVYGVVTSPGNSTSPGFTEGQTAAPAGGVPIGNYHNGLQYCYYNVVSSATNGGSASNGGITKATLNSTVPFNASGSQTGQLQDINGDGITDVGDTAEPTNIAKPRAANAIWDDAVASDTNTTDANGNEIYTFHGAPNIVVSGNKVSFLLETLTYHVGASLPTGTVKFSPSVPTANLAGGLVPANWWEGNATENQQVNTQTPNNNTYANGTSVQLVGASPTTTTTTVANKIISLTAKSGGVTYGTLLTAGGGANQATFNPNTPTPNAINVTNTGPGGYTKGFANSISAGAGAGTDTAEVAGFAAADTEIYALKFSNSSLTQAQLSQIVTDINLNETGVTASLPDSTVTTLFPGYQIELKSLAGSQSADQLLAFDFTQETNVPGLLVTDIAAVPEPASIGLLVGAAGMLLGRRRNRSA